MTLRYLVIILFFVFGCKPIEPVNFIEVKDVKINRSKDDGIFITAQIILENPNKVKITINIKNLKLFGVLFELFCTSQIYLLRTDDRIVLRVREFLLGRFV